MAEAPFASKPTDIANPRYSYSSYPFPVVKFPIQEKDPLGIQPVTSPTRVLERDCAAPPSEGRINHRLGAAQ